jgi:hypothetical protein
MPVFSQDVDLLSREHVEKYARFLFSSNPYKYAAEEYERLVFMDRENESYQISLLKSYRLAGEYTMGIRTFNLFHEKNSSISPDLLKEYSKINLLSGETENLNFMLKEWPMDNTFRDNLDLTLRLVSYPEGTLNLEGLNKNSLNKGLLALYSEAFNLKHKNRFLAASMSTVVPSLGKVYAGRWKDAVISLVFIVGTGYQAYRAFKDHGISSVYGWIMGTVSFGFYLGNIHGSAKAARIYNHNQHMQYHEKVVDHYINSY